MRETMPYPKWRSILVDQSPAESHELCTLIKAHCPQLNVRCESWSVAETVANIQDLRVNLVFCNVQIADGDAFEILDQLNDFQGYFILLASDEGFALRALRYKIFDYLLKPISANLLLDVVARLDTHPTAPDPNPSNLEFPSQRQKFATIILNTKGVEHVIQITKIVRLEGDGNYSTVHLDTGERFLVSKPLKRFEEMLPARAFFRVHQSHLVNLTHVKSVQHGNAHSLCLSTGDLIPLARRKKEVFRNWLARL